MLCCSDSMKISWGACRIFQKRCIFGESNAGWRYFGESTQHRLYASSRVRLFIKHIKVFFRLTVFSFPIQVTWLIFYTVLVQVLIDYDTRSFYWVPREEILHLRSVPCHLTQVFHLIEVFSFVCLVVFPPFHFKFYFFLLPFLLFPLSLLIEHNNHLS